MKRFRLVDLPLVVKLAFAPAFALVMLALLAGVALWSQTQQTATLDRVVKTDMAQSLQLAAQSKRITAVHGDLYLLMTRQAAGDMAQTQARLDALMKETDAIKADLAKIKGSLPKDQQAAFNGVIKDLTDYRGGIEVVGSMLGLDFATAAAFVAPFEAHYARMTGALDKAVTAAQTAAAERAKASAKEAAFRAQLAVALVLSTLAAVGLISFMVVMGVRRAVKGIAEATERVAEGDDRVNLDALHRGDELGAVVRSLEVFRENQQRIVALRRDQESSREREEGLRQDQERTRAEQQAEQQAVVEALASGLEKLASGDLSHRLDRAFPPAYDKLRNDFNAAVNQLAEAMTAINGAASSIRSGTDEISNASEDLSRRTEQQAASLEETAAALDEITATVRRMAEGANRADTVVKAAKAGAEESGEVARKAVGAMGEIARFSTQIGNIIGVIDEIAFQTNLLALNAGVEAARAGDAGKGFAVVASEVRALAQRSAEAAKEIKTLISASTQQVGDGVALVDQTGKALDTIVTRVVEISGLVEEIAASAREQATGLGEVNTAMNQMDQVTQQNAAMVEEATAASHALAREAQDLAGLVGRFRLSDAPAPAASSRPEPMSRPAARPMARPAPRTSGANALKMAPSAEWEEF